MNGKQKKWLKDNNAQVSYNEDDNVSVSYYIGSKIAIVKGDTAEDAIDNAMRYDQFITMAKPLIKFLNDNFYPHSKIIIQSNRAEIFSSEISFFTNEFTNK